MGSPSMTLSRDGSSSAPGSESSLARLHAALSRVTHDINNPLAIISGNAQFLGELARGGAVEAEVAQAALDIEEASERLAALLRGLSALKEEVAAVARASGK